MKATTGKQLKTQNGINPIFPSQPYVDIVPQLLGDFTSEQLTVDSYQ